MQVKRIAIGDSYAFPLDHVWGKDFLATPEKGYSYLAENLILLYAVFVVTTSYLF